MPVSACFHSPRFMSLRWIVLEGGDICKSRCWVLSSSVTTVGLKCWFIIPNLSRKYVYVPVWGHFSSGYFIIFLPWHLYTLQEMQVGWSLYGETFEMSVYSVIFSETACSYSYCRGIKNSISPWFCDSLRRRELESVCITSINQTLQWF